MGDRGPERGRLGADSLERGALKERALHGVRWVTLGRLAAALLGMAAAVALARLIPPSEFGRAAVAMILNAFAVPLATQGFGTALVQRKTIDRDHVEAAFAVSLATGLLLSTAAFLLAPVVFSPLFGAQTADLARLMSPAFLLRGLAAVPQALLLRRLDFRATSLIETGALAVGASTSVALALAGLEGEALVLGVLAGSAATAIAALAVAGVPVPRWRHEHVRAISSFGAPATLSSLVYTAERHVDYAILGARLAPAQVGFYWRAYTLGVEAQGKVGGIVMRLALPLLSRTQTLDDLRAVRLRIARMHATLILPPLALFIALAPDLIPWVFGPAWEPSVLPAQILAVAGMASALGTGNGPAVLAVGRPDFLLRWNVGRLVTYSAVILVASSYGLTAVCLAVAGYRLVLMLLNYHVLLGRIVGVPMRRLLTEVAPGAVSSGVLLLAAFPLVALLTGAGAGAPVVLPVGALVGGAVYLACVRTLFPAAFAEVMLVVRRVLRSPTRPPEAVALAPTGAEARLR